jgi:hypothetical protein
LYIFLNLPNHATCPTQLAFPELITLTVSGEQYTLWNFSLCNFPYSLVTAFLLSPDNLLYISPQSKEDGEEERGR